MGTTAALLSPAVEHLDPSAVLAGVGDAETAERRAGAHKLELALQWCLLHPAADPAEAAVWGDSGLPGFTAPGFTECDETLGGQGAPLVAAFAPEPFAASLGVSTFTGMQLLADALDLAFRLPTTWGRVRALEVAPWKARRLAQLTHRLSADAAAYVDAHLAERLDSCGVRLIDRTIAQAAATFDPSAQAEAEQAGRQAWNVRLLHRTDGDWAGTSHLDATGDTVDLVKLYDLVCDHAAHLARLGDTDTLGQRKAKALGIIADAQAHLDLFEASWSTGSRETSGSGGAGAGGGPEGEADDTAVPVTVRRPSLSKSRVYLHLRLCDLIDPLTPSAAGEVERLGPATTAKIRDWLGTTRATIVPVLDSARDDAVDEHDPPEWMREIVILRDRHCVFPWCQVDARSCDLDHTVPYVPVDEGGPPGQTAPSKLACLCRRHHNAKTTRRWQYQRNRDGTYTWHGPDGLSYLVTATGTRDARS